MRQHVNLILIPQPFFLTFIEPDIAFNYTLILDETHGSYKTGDQKIVFKAKKSECDGQPYSIAYPLPAYGTAIFRF